MRSAKKGSSYTLALMVAIWLVGFHPGFAQSEKKQETEQAYQPIVLKLNEDGQKYIRLIMWHQVWVATNNLAAEPKKLQLSTSIRRSRFLAYAQVSPKFLILTHWGLNSLNGENLSSLGNNGDAPQLFLHGAWTEFKVNEELYLGAGLHYWNGLTRLASASTLNFMTLDQSRPFVHWHSLGITDQFGRHLGVYAKGQAGRFDYRLAINTPGHNPLGAGKDYGGRSDLTYTGVSTRRKDNDLAGDGASTGNTILTGYFRYNFWEREATKLPYQVGTYLGQKKVFNIGAGFFAHPNGMYNQATGRHENVAHFALDAFMDLPTRGGGWTAYAAYLRFNYGERYMSRWAGTGSVVYGQRGYFVRQAKVMPYVAFQSGQYEAYPDPLQAVDIGLNFFISSHNAKLTLEYHRIAHNPLEGGVNEAGAPNIIQQLRLQAQIFL